MAPLKYLSSGEVLDMPRIPLAQVLIEDLLVRF